MGIDKIAMKVKAKKSDGVHEGKLPGVKDIKASLNKFKKDVKPIEKRPLEKNAGEAVGSILKRMFEKGKGDPSKGIPKGDERTPMPKDDPKPEKKETPKQEKAEEASPAKKIADKVKGKPAAPPAEKGGFAAMLAKVKGKGK
jgi:hypothetical protein